jgi:hypothetical protein
MSYERPRYSWEIRPDGDLAVWGPINFIPRPPSEAFVRANCDSIRRLPLDRQDVLYLDLAEGFFQARREVARLDTLVRQEINMVNEKNAAIRGAVKIGEMLRARTPRLRTARQSRVLRQLQRTTVHPQPWQTRPTQSERRRLHIRQPFRRFASLLAAIRRGSIRS